MGWRYWKIILVIFIPLFFGCSEEKSLGPVSVLPETGTRLYFADCFPFAPGSERIGLTTDSDDICTESIMLQRGDSADWESNVFRVTSSFIKEGYRLLLERSTENASVTGVIHVHFCGLTGSSTERIEFPSGETSKLVEIVQSGEVIVEEDTLLSVRIALVDSIGKVQVNLTPSSGSFVIIGVPDTDICRFEFRTEGNHIGQPGESMPLEFLYPGAAITTELHRDFTGGAQIVSDEMLQFGPMYGICYLAAESDDCRDTAAFYAPAPQQGWVSADIGTFEDPCIRPCGEADACDRLRFLSDGDDVWIWKDSLLSGSEDWCRDILITDADANELVQHPVYSCSDDVEVYLKRTVEANPPELWIVLRSPGSPDTAWLFDRYGVPDSVWITDEIPGGHLFGDTWVQSAPQDEYSRLTEFTAFDGTISEEGPLLAVEITEDFSGNAGLDAGLTDSTAVREPRLEPLSVNLFDPSGNWIARYPVDLGTGCVDVGIIGSYEDNVTYTVTNYDEQTVNVISLRR